jgi:hypothetical protein
MNLKKLAVGAAIAASVVGGSIAVSAPAEANSLRFAGTARLENSGVGIGGTSQLNFFDYANTSSGTGTIFPVTHPAFGTPPNPVTLKDLTLTKTSATSWVLSTPTLANFITGLGASGNFNLTSFTLNFLSPSTYRAGYTGFFSNFSQAIGVGGFTTQAPDFTGNDGDTFSTSVTIPTPALLPALLGMGVAALRKRKGEETEPGTVEVKA